jgi:hypothetical protein
MARNVGSPDALPLAMDLIQAGIVVRGQVLEAYSKWVGKEKNKELGCYDVYTGRGTRTVTLQVWDTPPDMSLVGMPVVAKCSGGVTMWNESPQFTVEAVLLDVPQGEYQQ